VCIGVHLWFQFLACFVARRTPPRGCPTAPRCQNPMHLYVAWHSHRTDRQDPRSSGAAGLPPRRGPSRRLGKTPCTCTRPGIRLCGTDPSSLPQGEGEDLVSCEATPHAQRGAVHCRSVGGASALSCHAAPSHAAENETAVRHDRRRPAARPIQRFPVCAGSIRIGRVSRHAARSRGAENETIVRRGRTDPVGRLIASARSPRTRSSCPTGACHRVAGRELRRR